MKKKRFWRWAVAFLITIAIIIFFVDMSAYGVHNKVKNGILKLMLSDDVPKISVADASKKHGSATFLDSRSPEEFNESHIAGALWVGYDDFNLSRVQSIPKQEEIIVYCSIGKRSDEVTKKLQEAGFLNVRNLYGGIFEWFNQGNKIVDNSNNDTDTIHAYSKLFGWWLNRGNKVY